MLGELGVRLLEFTGFRLKPGFNSILAPGVSIHDFFNPIFTISIQKMGGRMSRTHLALTLSR